jgi:hypothetical protein
MILKLYLIIFISCDYTSLTLMSFEYHYDRISFSDHNYPRIRGKASNMLYFDNYSELICAASLANTTLYNRRSPVYVWKDPSGYTKVLRARSIQLYIEASEYICVFNFIAMRFTLTGTSKWVI